MTFAELITALAKLTEDNDLTGDEVIKSSAPFTIGLPLKIKSVSYSDGCINLAS